MGNQRQAATAVLVLGLIVVVVSALADLLGVGQPGFGQRQVAGIVIGLIVAGLGYGWRRRLTRSR